MAWIRTTDAEAADERLAEVYARVSATRGRIANVWKVYSVQPSAMAAHLELYRTLMFGPSELTRRERETIAVAVSVTNGCRYCIEHHAAALRAHGEDPLVVESLCSDALAVALPPRTGALVRYAVQLTQRPTAVTAVDVEAVRRAGHGDAAIHDAAAITGHFNFVNRLVLGLGVELEE